MAAAPNALQPVAWECGNCAHTNEGTEPGPCAGCDAPEPVRYMIFKKKTGITAPTARTCSVDRCTQLLLSSAATPADSLSRREVVEILTGNVVDIVGITQNDRGRSCDKHYCCGTQIGVHSKVKFVKERLAYRNGGEEEDVIAVYCVGDGVVGCKVGFLPQHLVTRGAGDYDGLYARVIEIYSEMSRNSTKRQKHYRNDGVAVAKIMGDNAVFAI
jgi:hypothetical protein